MLKLETIKKLRIETIVAEKDLEAEPVLVIKALERMVAGFKVWAIYDFGKEFRAVQLSGRRNSAGQGLVQTYPVCPVK